MSLTDNTTGLRSILSAVNALPEAGSGGIEVQRKSSTLTTDGNGKATVNCGFQPDIVYLSFGEGGDGYIYSATAAFEEEKRSGVMNLAMWSNANNALYVEDIIITRLSTGFSIEIIWVLTSNWETGPDSNIQLSYTAVKYT